MASSWKDDAHFVGAFVRGGDWEIGLRVARNVTVDNGNPNKAHARSSTRVSLKEFAREAGISEKTVAKYLAAWEWAALERVVDPSTELDPDDEYDWGGSGPTPEDWAVFYKKACQNPPPWNPRGGALEPRKYPERNVGKDHVVPTPEQVRAAIKSDPELAEAAAKAWVEVAEKKRAARRGNRKIVDPEPEPTFEQMGPIDKALYWADAAVEEAGRREELRDIHQLAVAIRERVDTWAERYGHTGVPDEVEQINEASAALTDAQWKLAEFAVESAEEGAR
jgi:hypothetical protein